MTTLMVRGESLVLRCDACRRLWPITRERLESTRWTRHPGDRHLCPVCNITDATASDHPEPACQTADG